MAAQRNAIRTNYAKSRIYKKQKIADVNNVFTERKLLIA